MVASAARRSPTVPLLVGLVLTLAIVVGYSGYISRQIASLQALQSTLTDRNQREALQLLRIQSDLNQLGLAMRDMLADDARYPLTAWASQFARIRSDLDVALARQATLAVATRTPEQSDYLASSLSQFWDASERVFDLARSGQADAARQQIQSTLQARQAALTATVSRLLVQNTASGEQTARETQQIYATVQRQVYVFLAVVLVAIAATSLFLIRSNRLVFADLAALSDERRDLARQLIATRESIFREIARELHDDFGQVLTAIGSMLGRASRHLPEESPVRPDLREIGEIAQGSLDNVRRLSQMLHPSTLEELGLDSAIEWYVSTADRQLGVAVAWQRTGTPQPVDPTLGIHVFRVLQEALTNVARHAGTHAARVGVHYTPGALELTVEDDGPGLTRHRDAHGVGLVTMRERAAIVGGTITFETPASGGTRVRLLLPLASGAPS